MPIGQYCNLTTYRDRLAKVIARIDEFDYLFPAHGFVNLENHLLSDTMDALNEIIASPDVYNFKSFETSENGGPDREVMEKYIRGFSSIAYTRDGISPAKS